MDEEEPEFADPDEDDPESDDEEDVDPDDEDVDGVCVGDCRLLLAEFADCVFALVLDVEWPWKDLAAATETAPVVATAPASIQRLIREISASPLSR